MYALFETTGWVGKEYALRAGGCRHIVGKLDYYQCLGCLAVQGRSMGTKEDQKELDKIEEFLSDCCTREDIENFGFDLSTGSFKCVMCAETKEEAIRMKEFIVGTEKDEEHKRKLEAFGSLLVESFDDDELMNRLEYEIGTRQYLTSGINNWKY